MKKTLFFALFLTFFTLNANAQNFSARVSRAELPYGETLMLILDYDGSDMNLKPDLSVLDKDFKVFSTSQSHSTQIINGNVSSSNQWQVALMPKTKGAVTIPEISLGTLKSNPVALNVFEGSINGQDGTPTYARFELNGELENKTAYVQGQLNYTLTLLDAGGLQANAPQFAETQDWIIRQIKQPTVENKIVNNVNVREIKFYYALFPQKSGILETPEVSLEGFYINTNQPRRRHQSMFAGGFFDAGIDVLDMMAARSPISLSVKQEKVEVMPIATDFGRKWWLPAKNVKVGAEWSDRNQRFKVGEAVERTISLAAVGVLDTQLPEFRPEQSSDFKQYPEKPSRSSVIDEDGNVIALEEFINVYIPQKAGKITVPAISIAWFDTVNNRTEYAVVPEENIIVEPNPEMLPEKPYTDYAMPNFADNQAEKTSSQAKSSQNVYYISILAVLLAFFTGLIFSYLLFGKNKKTETKIPEIKAKDIENLAKKADFKGLRDALIIWAQDHYKTSRIADLQTIGEIADNKEFSEQLTLISQNLYGKKQQNWDADKFISAFGKIKKQKNKTKKSADPLPNLYKDKM